MLTKKISDLKINVFYLGELYCRNHCMNQVKDENDAGTYNYGFIRNPDK